MMVVTIATKGEFSFSDNQGCLVRITKWTGKDCVDYIYIKPQIVTLDKNLDLRIEVENPNPERSVSLRRFDKIACLSILSSSIPPAVFSPGVTLPLDKLQTESERWFKVSTIVLHRKGEYT